MQEEHEEQEMHGEHEEQDQEMQEPAILVWKAGETMAQMRPRRSLPNWTTSVFKTRVNALLVHVFDYNQ